MDLEYLTTDLITMSQGDTPMSVRAMVPADVDKVCSLLVKVQSAFKAENLKSINRNNLKLVISSLYKSANE